MKKYRLSHGQFNWPKICAECGERSTHFVESACSVVTKVGYHVLFTRTTHLRASVFYPVCQRHSLLAQIASTISARNLFNLALGVGWVYCTFALVMRLYNLVVGTERFHLQMFAWLGGLSLGGLAVFLFAQRYTPVRLVGANSETLTCSFRSDSYAAEFVKLNPDLVIEEIPWWKT